MFFVGIFGVQNKSKIIKEFDSVICPNCGRWTRAELIEEYTYFHMFFIPLFKWGKKYYVRLRCCGALYEAAPEYASDLKTAANIDFEKLSKIGPAVNTCPHCGNPVDPGFSFCPRCGEKL